MFYNFSRLLWTSSYVNSGNFCSDKVIQLHDLDRSVILLVKTTMVLKQNNQILLHHRSQVNMDEVLRF